jgi:DNA polymerase-3 subunit beta
MKVTINAAALRTAADLASKAVASRPVTPLLACVCLTARDGQLAMHATDYDSWLRTSFSADVQTTATVVVSARLLAAVASAMPAGDVDLVCESGTLTVTGAGRARSTLPTRPAEDFPAWPEAVAGQLRTVDGPTFSAALEACGRISAAAPDASPHIRRVTLVPTADGVRMLATDAYRLLSLDLPWSEPATGGDALETVALDPDTVGSMVTLAKTTERTVLSFPTSTGSDSRFELGAGSARAIAAVMGGRSIEYGAALAQVRPDRHVVVDSRDLLELAAKVAPFGTTDSAGAKAKPIAIITISAGELAMRAGDEESGSMADVIPTQGWTGDEWRAGVNPVYLADVVKALPAGLIRFSVGPPNRPMHFAPEGQDPLTTQAVLMPIRIPEGRP